jgi:hypothetical protein
LIEAMKSARFHLTAWANAGQVFPYECATGN